MANEFKKECGLGMYWCNTDKKCKPIQEANAAAIASATAIAKKKSGNYDKKGFRKTPYKNPDAPNVKTNAQRRKEMKEDAPVNAVGGGQVAGLGVGPQGEPGISKKKKLASFISFIRRK